MKFRGFDVISIRKIKTAKIPCNLCNAKYTKCGQRGEHICVGCLGYGWYSIAILTCRICGKEDFIDNFAEINKTLENGICLDCEKSNNKNH